MMNEKMRIEKAEAFYTGGGIWISMMYVDENIYYTIDNDSAYLYKYDHRDEEEEFYNLIECKSLDELNEYEEEAFCKLKAALDEKLI